MNMEWIVSRGQSGNRVFTDSVFDGLEEFFMFVCPVEESRVLSQVMEGLTIHMAIFDIATVKSKVS